MYSVHNVLCLVAVRHKNIAPLADTFLRSKEDFGKENLQHSHNSTHVHVHSTVDFNTCKSNPPQTVVVYTDSLCTVGSMVWYRRMYMHA